MRLPLIASLTLLASSAAAQTEPPPPPPPMPVAAPAAPPPPEEAPRRIVSVTFSPIHLIFPIAEVTVEGNINNKIGIAVIGGYGSLEATDGIQKRKLSAFEAGAHVNYYVIGSFDHGMQLGVEALYVKVATDDNVQVSGAANGLAIGPYVGYKIITRVGFTFEANGGVQYVAAKANATDGTSSAQKSDSKVIPLLNLNVGWSF